MSYVTFQTELWESNVSRRERTRLDAMMARIAGTVLQPLDYKDYFPKLMSYIPERERDTFKRAEFEHVLRFYFTSAFGEEPVVFLDGARQTVFSTILNTIIDMGNEQLCFAARMCGQCEMHAYVMPENRLWLGELIQKGLDSYIFSPNAGWQNVVDNLDKHNSSYPIVMSYSGSDDFPNKYMATLTGNKSVDDKWYNLDNIIRWQLACDGLYHMNTTQYLEIKPDTILRQGFENGKTYFNILREVLDEKEEND